MRKIIYYSSAAEAITHAAQLAQDGYACYMDQPIDEEIFSPVIGMDSDTVEQARELLFERMAQGTDFESAIIRAVFYTHYPRLFRCHASLARHPKAAYFAPQEKTTCYDLALAYGQQTEFLNLQDGQTRPCDLHTLVEFYQPSGYVTRFKKRLGLRLKSGSGGRTGRAAAATGASDRRVLFLAHDNEVNLYLKPVAPIMTELAGRGIGYSVISCDSRARRFLEQETIPHINSEDLPPAADAVDADETGTMARWFQDRIDTEIKPTGEDLYDALMRCALNSATRRDLWESRKSAQRIVEHATRERITDVFFVPDGTPVAGELARTFITDGVRTHTIIASGISRFKRAVDFYFSETLYCSGSLAASALEHHFPGRRICTVGNPALQRYVAMGAATSSDPRTMVLVATSGFDVQETTWMAELMAAIDADRFRLVFKPHPSHADRYVHLQSLVHSGHQVATATTPIEGLVNAADIVITDHSQVGVDAHLLGKPVISMSTAKSDILYMKDIASIKYVRSIPALIQGLDEVLSKSSIDPEFIAMFNAGGDSNYYKRVVDHVLSA